LLKRRSVRKFPFPELTRFPRAQAFQIELNLNLHWKVGESTSLPRCSPRGTTGLLAKITFTEGAPGAGLSVSLKPPSRTEFGACQRTPAEKTRNAA
jgi:hypothetical protein